MSNYNRLSFSVVYLLSGSSYTDIYVAVAKLYYMLHMLCFILKQFVPSTCICSVILYQKCGSIFTLLTNSSSKVCALK